MISRDFHNQHLLGRLGQRSQGADGGICCASGALGSAWRIAWLFLAQFLTMFVTMFTGKILGRMVIEQFLKLS
jgi:hypothetical protein